MESRPLLLECWAAGPVSPTNKMRLETLSCIVSIHTKHTKLETETKEIATDALKKRGKKLNFDG